MTTPEERARHRNALIEQINLALTLRCAPELSGEAVLRFHLAVLDEYEALLAKHEEWGSIAFKEVNMEEYKLWLSRGMQNAHAEESNET